ncbi:uncharacterized protein LOC131934585 [Physella acuta]|uniref:uncharacterized protein LOC131934585 n=1 Tax=Physella acuta TaxID=109671 RepID=UPI0027DADEDD|nr:uncharacterized protein LOC131934585 [Physella acuta]
MVFIVFMLVIFTNVHDTASEAEIAYEWPTKEKVWCELNGERYHEGVVFGVPANTTCNTFKCVNGSLVAQHEGCELKNNCYTVGDQFELSCSTYKCDKITQDTVTQLSVELVLGGCSDSGKKCHKVGEVFPSSFNGVAYKNCSCVLQGNAVNVHCR